MYYTIYKITNQITGKFYIGKHKTSDLDDDYMGSGKLLKYAIQKYGIENFTKEYLEILDSEEKMNLAEKIYVITDNEVSYNLCEGGKGGWSYINSNIELVNKRDKKEYKIKGRLAADKVIEEKYGKNWRQAFSAKASKKGIECLKKKYPNGTFFGKKHNDLTKEKIGKANSIRQKGINNSNYGKMWITNGQDNKLIIKNDIDNWIKLGYYKGRII